MALLPFRELLDQLLAKNKVVAFSKQRRMLAAALNGVSIAEVRRTGIVREKTGVSLNDSQRKGLLRNGVLFKKKSALVNI